MSMSVVPGNLKKKKKKVSNFAMKTIKIYCHFTDMFYHKMVYIT